VVVKWGCDLQGDKWKIVKVILAPGILLPLPLFSSFFSFLFSFILLVHHLTSHLRKEGVWRGDSVNLSIFI
jgi:hypothetical protein